jgi:tetratricopeptide (TPR) repeat protein
MLMHFRPAYGLAIALAAAILAPLTGCSPGAMDDREERDPMLRRAQSRKEAQDIDGAIDLYNKAIDRKPGLARAHFDLGLIYDQEKHDYLRAIYHYERYLELRPGAEKKQYIEGMIRHARISFAASLPERPVEAVREIKLLKEEVEALRKQLEEQSKVQASAGFAAVRPSRSAEAPPAPAAPTNAPSPAKGQTPAPPPAPAAPGRPMETYTVQVGDNLSRIAAKVYGDKGKWEKIYNANKDKLPTAKSVKVGQTLVIPRP